MEQLVYSANNGAAPASVNDQHLACVLLLDSSGSMQGDAISRLNAAVAAFKDQCCADDALCRGLEISIVSFASKVKIMQEFSPITQMNVPTLVADGQTSMGAAIDVAIDLIESRKQLYKTIGVPYHRPWIFMITDGAPNDRYAEAFERVNEMQRAKKLELWAVGVPGYDRNILNSITKRVIELSDSLDFASLFEWLSNSLSVRSSSNPGDRVVYDTLPDTCRVIPNDWQD